MASASSVGSRMALWEVALVPWLYAVLKFENSLHNASSKISPDSEDIPSLDFRRSSQDVLQGRGVAFLVPSPSLSSAVLCTPSLLSLSFPG